MRAALLLLLAVPLLTEAQRPVPSEEPQVGRPQPVVSPPSEGGQVAPVRGQVAKPVEVGRDAPSFQPEIGRNKEKYVAGQVLVRFRRDTPKSWMNIAHGVVRAKVLQDFQPIDGLYLVRIPAEVTVEEAVAAYGRQPEVLYAQPNYIYHALPTNPNDTFYANGTQWDMNNTGQNFGTPDADIDAPEAWDITQGSSSVEVVVIDTGIDFTHPDLAANVDSSLSRNCVSGTCVAGGTDDNNHGTHVAGTIGAVGNNGTGVVGVNWTVKLIACKFLNSSGSGSTAGAIACLNYVKSLKDLGTHPNLIATNNSWGGVGFDPALDDAIEAQRQSGILFIAAAGNDNTENNTSPHFPANFFVPNVISVASTTRTDAISGFSDFGRQTVHLGAPGSVIVSTSCYASEPGSGPCTHSFLTFSGTSMATPHVTGVAALLKAQDPNRDWKTIKNLILSSGDSPPILDRITVTGKRLNAFKALTCSDRVTTARLMPVGNPIVAQVGVPVTLAALNINCANPNGNVNVTVNPGNQLITLLDNGVNPDEEQNDGIYTGQWIPGSSADSTLTFPGGDVVTVFFTSKTYTSSNPGFNYRDITATGVNLNFGDDSATRITSPFPIFFAGVPFPYVFVASNGVISFTGPYFGCPDVDFDCINLAIPTTQVQTLVAPFWDDLFPSGANNVFFAVTGSAPNRELVIEWRNVMPVLCGSGGARFEVVFFENSGNILFNYLQVNGFSSCFGDPNNGGSATVGVQITPAAAGFATQFSMNTPSLSNNQAILWQSPVVANNPVPVVSSLSPDTIPATSPQFTLTVNGSNFVDGAVVRFKGLDKVTTFVNSTKLTALIPATDVMTVGTAQVRVFNPAPAGGLSNAVSFTIGIRNPLPTITSLSPAGSTTTGSGILLNVFGSNFVFNSTVRWNAANRTTTFISSNQLQASLNAGDLSSPGTGMVTVSSPSPGGGISNTANFLITTSNPVPVILNLSQTSVVVGTVRDNLTFNVNGTGSTFVATSVVRWNGSNRTTMFVNPNQLTVTIPSSDVSAAGTAQVTVFTPAPGGGTSNAQTFTINNPVPGISSLSPSSTNSGGLQFTLTVIGSNFVPGAVVRWNGSNRTTTFIGSNQLRATIPASDIASPGTANVTVLNPTPGGGGSNTLTFTIN